MRLSDAATRAMEFARNLAESHRNEFITPEHLLLSMTLSSIRFGCSLKVNGGDPEYLGAALDHHIKVMEKVPEGNAYKVGKSHQLSEVLYTAEEVVKDSDAKMIDIPHLVYGISELRSSYACHLMRETVKTSIADLLRSMADPPVDTGGKEKTSSGELEAITAGEIIGRENEISEIMNILLRMEGNNVLLIGDHGVGKSAIIGAVASRLGRDDVPKRLRGRKMVSLSLPRMASGTEYSGSLEKKILGIMETLKGSGDHVVVIEDLHDLSGFGGRQGTTYDLFSMLLPYFKDSAVPFIATTTFEDYKGVQAKCKAVERFFSRVEVNEPDETLSMEIAKAVKGRIEQFHGVTFTDEAVACAVRESSSFRPAPLPGRAVGILDECGAVAEKEGRSAIDADTVRRLLNAGAKESSESDDPVTGLEERLRARIYGQDEAILQVCSALYLSRSGLGNPQKPLGSFLFVGPTGVGKTQLAKELASSLSVPLVRFDMSEYAEKHTVAKFIGSPAGYVGYEDGGLLTDAIRKSPRCVLLLDEIEKAHQDIYNLMLQIMDYGTLTDSHGRKADFHDAVIIMTSNAGARYSSQSPIGFGKTADPGKAMGTEVLKTFAPEFINRLSATVIFNSMDRDMAASIRDSKLADLDALLAQRGITVTYSDSAREELLRLGHSAEYGAREMERAIDSMIKTLLVREILFGSLKKGGKAEITFEEEFKIKRIWEA